MKSYCGGLAMKYLSILLVLAALCSGSVLHAQPVQANTSYPTFLDALNLEPELSTFRAIVNALNLGSALNTSTAGYTAFLPSNSAFDAFLAAKGITIADLLATPDKATLLQLVYFHFVALQVNLTSTTTPLTVNTDTLLSNYSAATGSLLASSARLVVKIPQADNASSITITSSAGSTAKLLIYDMAAGSTVIQVIDAVLVYWFDTIAQVLQANISYSGSASLGLQQTYYPAAQFVQGLQDGGLWGLLNDSSSPVNYTCFVPVSMAAAYAYLNYGQSVMDAFLSDIMAYHVAVGPFFLRQNPAVSSAVTISQYLRNTTTAEKITVASDFGAPITIKSIGADGNVFPVVFPVGGIGSTKSYVYYIDVVLMPVYTGVSNYLIRTGGGYGFFGNMISETAADTFMRGKNGTLFAPSELAVQAWWADGDYAYVRDNAALLTWVLRNHFVTPPVPLSSILTLGSVTNWTSLQGDNLQIASQAVDVNGTNFGGSVTVTETTTGVTYAIYGIGPQDIPVLYNTSSFGIVNISMVMMPAAAVAPPPPSPPPPRPPPSPPQGGSASMPVPSLLHALTFLLMGVLYFKLH